MLTSLPRHSWTTEGDPWVPPNYLELMTDMERDTKWFCSIIRNSFNVNGERRKDIKKKVSHSFRRFTCIRCKKFSETKYKTSEKV